MSYATTPKCKICGGATSFVFALPSAKETGKEIPLAKDDCPYFECTDCEFLFSTCHDNDDHREIYDSAYWAKESSDQRASLSACMRLILLSNFLIQRPPYDLSILDFGCGLGGFVEIARRDLKLKVWGTDINIPRWGKDYFLSGPNDVKFDMVIAVEVVEHFPSPLKTFEYMKSFLAPGGTIAFQTAQYMPKQCGRDWWYLGPANGHISLYSERSLDHMYDALGGRKRVSWAGYKGVQAWQFK